MQTQCGLSMNAFDGPAAPPLPFALSGGLCSPARRNSPVQGELLVRMTGNLPGPPFLSFGLCLQLCLELCLTAYSGITGTLGGEYFLRTMARNATYPPELSAKKPDSDLRLQILRE